MEYQELIQAILNYQLSVEEFEQRAMDGDYPPHSVYEIAMLEVASALLRALEIPGPRNIQDIETEVRALREFFRKNRKPISESLRLEIYARDNFSCKHCGTTERLTIDHIFPVCKGGTNDWDNLQTLCSLCNSKKRDN